MTDKTEARPADALDDQDLEAVHGGISGSEILQTVVRVATAVVPAALQAVASSPVPSRESSARLPNCLRASIPC